MPSAPAYKRPIRRIRRPGFWWGMGKQVNDPITGWDIPIRLTTIQRGQRIARDPKYGSFYRPNKSRF
jgi:hypothetical protein